jgi:hypothetical protein
MDPLFVGMEPSDRDELTATATAGDAPVASLRRIFKDYQSTDSTS